MNKITVLINNIILIGDTEDVDGGIRVTKPFSMQGGNGQDHMLTPFLEAHLGQEVPEVIIKSEHVLTSIEAENNDILQGYLQKISGIELPKQEILLG